MNALPPLPGPWKKVVREAVRQGFTVEKAGHGYKVLSPEGRRAAFLSGTIRDVDRRALLNLRSNLRRHGFRG